MRTGVVAENDPGPVDEILAYLQLASDTTFGADTQSSAAAPAAHTAGAQIVQHFAAKSSSKVLTTRAGGPLDTYMYDRGLIDLLMEFPGAITAAAELVSVLTRLAPHLYSISSRPSAHGREVHGTVAVVRYRADKRERGGIASTMLADRVGVNERLPIYIQPKQANP